MDDATSSSDITISVAHGSTTHKFSLYPTATLKDLSSTVAAALSIPDTNQKFILPGHGLQKSPFRDLALAPFTSKKIILMGTSVSAVASFQEASILAAARHQSRLQHRHVRPLPRRPAGPSTGADNYTFLVIRPLPNLPHPQQSQALLERLRDDPGIRAAMRKHRFTVGLLTEMEPLANTQVSHEGTSRLLGLNRNQGEVIELRLRTDAHDGYRDYKTIRRTLCHELAHNVHGPHDRSFWDLCHQIEREVEAADWTRTGRTVGGEEEGAGEHYYTAGMAPPSEEDEIEDAGGWVGGEFVLGGQGTAQGLTRREVLAKAAEERQRKSREEGAGQS